jgi:hypothetical protein
MNRELTWPCACVGTLGSLVQSQLPLASVVGTAKGKTDATGMLAFSLAWLPTHPSLCTSACMYVCKVFLTHFFSQATSPHTYRPRRMLPWWRAFEVRNRSPVPLRGPGCS